MDKSKSPLKVALHGMDGRSYKMMAMYLQGPCKGVAVVVNDNNAECDIFDADAFNAEKLLNERLQKSPHRPVIVISLTDRKLENVLYVKKPVKIEDMVAALSQAKKSLGLPAKQTSTQPAPATVNRSVPITPVSTDTHKTNDIQPTADKQALKKFVLDTDEQKKTSKHQAAMLLSEQGFGAFIGNVVGVDVNDPKQFAKATYNPKEYFQGYVESAIRLSYEKAQIRQLNSGWSPLVIFPHSNEVWLDADEKQLRAFAGLPISSSLVGKMSITPLSLESAVMNEALEKFHSVDAFLWKIACWASKGRYPGNIDIRHPVYLKNWPNFTRLLVTPHALRISALLIQGPRTLGNIAEVLNVKPQYVFVFVSAASSLGLAGQAKREVDVLVHTPDIKPNKNQGLLSRILSTLRGKKG